METYVYMLGFYDEHEVDHALFAGQAVEVGGVRNPPCL
jgi:hypothetical protein